MSRSTAILFLSTACEEPLGMQYGFIPDSSINASSTLSAAYAPKYGRLHSVFTARGGGAWCSGKTDSNQYLQIDLPKVMTIAGIATQGRQSADSSKSWIIKYKIWSKHESGLFVEYTEFGNQKVGRSLWTFPFFSFLQSSKFSIFFKIVFSFSFFFFSFILLLIVLELVNLAKSDCKIKLTHSYLSVNLRLAEEGALLRKCLNNK